MKKHIQRALVIKILIFIVAIYIRMNLLLFTYALTGLRASFLQE